MKTKSLLTLVAIALVSLVSANGIPELVIYSNHADQIVLTALNNDSFNYEITFESEKGDIVYYKQSETPKHNLQKIFDVKNLDNGNYKMVLKVNSMTIEKELLVTAKKIYFNETEMFQEPYFVFDGQNLKLTHLNFSQNKFNLKILNDGELVYKTKLGSDLALHTGYNLSKFENGNYKVVLSSAEKEFTYKFEK